MTITKFTRHQADLIIRHHISEFVTEQVTGGPEEFDQFSRQLSATVEADLPRHLVIDAVEDFEKIGDALDGRLEECEFNREGTVDNRQDLADMYGDCLTQNIEMMLDAAGIEVAR